MRILVVEDEKDMNRLIVKTLKKVGYSVDGCYDGEEALLNLMGAEYDAIVLDVMMPKKDGYELVKELTSPHLHGMFVTPKDIDETVKRISYTISEALNQLFSPGTCS